MAPLDMISACAVLGTSAYYLFAWVLFGRDPRGGTTIPLYRPPRDLSPALMRYVWKEEFDDRTFWASALSIVAKGMATMEVTDGQAVLRPRADAQHVELPSRRKDLVRETGEKWQAQGNFHQHARSGDSFHRSENGSVSPKGCFGQVVSGKALFSVRRNFAFPLDRCCRCKSLVQG